MKTYRQKLKELRAASAAQKAERETIFAQIDEAIATQRPMIALSILEKDHGPMLKRLRKVAANAVKGEKVSIAENDLRTLLAFADEALFA